MLFTQDTRESVSEATLLYQMASEILGKRPAELGDCGESAERRTMGGIEERLDADAELLLEVETWLLGKGFARLTAHEQGVPGAGASRAVARASMRRAVQSGTGRAARHTGPMRRARRADAAFTEVEAAVALDLLEVGSLVEGLDPDPPASTLALFAPPIDPLLLARATAAGLSLDEAGGWGRDAETLARLQHTHQHDLMSWSTLEHPRIALGGARGHGRGAAQRHLHQRRRCLVQAAPGTEVSFTLSERHFPAFLGGQELVVDSAVACPRRCCRGVRISLPPEDARPPNAEVTRYECRAKGDASLVASLNLVDGNLALASASIVVPEFGVAEPFVCKDPDAKKKDILLNTVVLPPANEKSPSYRFDAISDGLSTYVTSGEVVLTRDP